jgi:glycosyltransferase involved in cell wall biosynthesis
MRIVALLALRNEAVYLQVCLDHLAAEGIETCIIDNGSSDESRDIAESYRDRGVFRIVDYPYPGFYDWTGLLKLKEQLAATIEADWFIHHDADEIRQAPRPWKTLAEGIEAADRDGWNAINFDEFVFLPAHELENYEGAGFASAMKHYYFFEPSTDHRINAWKKCGGPVDLVSTAGHRVSFPDRRVAPVAFILRHYIFLSFDHCLRKYTRERTYSKREVEDLKWHGWRARLAAINVRLPSRAELKHMGGGDWDRSDPRRSHLFLQGIE